MTPNPSTTRPRSAASIPPSASATSPRPAPPAKGSDHKAPIKTFRLGRIRAAIWENSSNEKKFYGVTFSRTYVDEAKNFHDSDSFGRDDLPLVEKLADRAHSFIFERLAGSKADGPAAGGDPGE